MEYQHGGDIYSQDIQMDYSANINPLGMPEAVRQALRDCLEREVCSLYPDSRCERLRQALGKHHGCLLYTSPSPRDRSVSRMPSSA